VHVRRATYRLQFPKIRLGSAPRDSWNAFTGEYLVPTGSDPRPLPLGDTYQALPIALLEPGCASSFGGRTLTNPCR